MWEVESHSQIHYSLHKVWRTHDMHNMTDYFRHGRDYGSKSK